MKILMNDMPPINNNSGVSVSGKTIGTGNWPVIISQEDIKTAIATTQRTWENLLASSDVNHYQGLIRPDYALNFKDNTVIKDGVIHLGAIDIIGCYEYNTNSPEDTAAICMMQAFSNNPNKAPIAAISVSVKLKEVFGDEEILFVAGTKNAEAKMAWGSYMVHYLKKCGINIKPMSIMDIIKLDPKGRIIWRWGDVRFGGAESQYSDDFTEWLYTANEKNLIFNTLPDRCNSKDISDKSLLLTGKNSRMLLYSDDISWAKENKDHLVLKPGLGASGNDVYFGRINDEQSCWEDLLNRKLEEGRYILQEEMLLPKISIPDLCDLAIDFNPTFYVDGKNIEYLYSVVRLDLWDSYWNRGKINVVKGGSFVEVFEED